VYFRGAGFVATPAYSREGLAPGMAFDGPAIIEQSDATSLVAPGFHARVDAAHNVLLERGPAADVDAALTTRRPRAHAEGPMREERSHG
jgi:hypothetical protein